MDSTIYLDPALVIQTTLNNAIIDEAVTEEVPPPEPPPEPPPVPSTAVTNFSQHLTDLKNLLDNATRLFIQMQNILSNYARHVEESQGSQESERKNTMLAKQMELDNTQQAADLLGPA